jgi:carbon monoxide dehydrogenase subunit G
MKLDGTHTIQAPRERIFAALTDPAILQKCIPGCQELIKDGDNHYNAKLAAGVGSIKSVFNASVTLADLAAPSHYKLIVEGKGQPGFVKGSGDFDLAEQDGATEIKYSGEVQAGGLIASVGQRMLQGAAKMMASRFFKSLESETANSPASEPEPAAEA